MPDQFVLNWHIVLVDSLRIVECRFSSKLSIQNRCLQIHAVSRIRFTCIRVIVQMKLPTHHASLAIVGFSFFADRHQLRLTRRAYNMFNKLKFPNSNQKITTKPSITVVICIRIYTEKLLIVCSNSLGYAASVNTTGFENEERDLSGIMEWKHPSEICKC